MLQIHLPILWCVNDNCCNAKECIRVDISDPEYGTTHRTGDSGDLVSNAGTAIYIWGPSARHLSDLSFPTRSMKTWTNSSLKQLELKNAGPLGPSVEPLSRDELSGTSWRASSLSPHVRARQKEMLSYGIWYWGVPCQEEAYYLIT